MNFDNGIIKTANLSIEDHQTIVDELHTFLPNAADGGQGRMFSQAPPVWIEIIASLATWQAVFKVSAVAFLAAYGKKLGEKAAEATPKMIHDFLGVLKRVTKHLARPPSITLKIPGPGVPFTQISLNDNPEQAFALFLIHLPGIQKAIDSLDISRIDSEIYVQVNDNTFILKWLNSDDYQVYHQSFDPAGKPQNDPQIISKSTDH